MNTTSLGNISEAKVSARLLEVGYNVAIPFGSGHHYDLIVEIAGRWRTVQVKTGRIRSGALVFNVVSIHSKSKAVEYTGDRSIEYFAVYCPDNSTCYLIPSNDLKTNGKATLRIMPAKNSQKRKVIYAGNYVL